MALEEHRTCVHAVARAASRPGSGAKGIAGVQPAAGWAVASWRVRVGEGKDARREEKEIQ
jgi:hypothetical protein